MKYNKLGNTELDVSVICLGTMTWGVQNSENNAHTQMDYALDQGVNFIDTAEMYPVPPEAKLQGKTESYIGTWLAARKNRDKVILATKVAGPGEYVKYIRGGPRLNKKHIHLAIENSLKRLQTDYVDLYQLHWPERKTNFFGQLGYVAPKEGRQDDLGIPISESLEALSELIQVGKVRYIGISNETPWGLFQFLRFAEQKNINRTRIVSIQNPYSLLNRTFEVGLAECSYREKVGLLAYSPLGFGVLSGKYLNSARPANARLTIFGKLYGRYTNELAIKATEAYVNTAKKYQLDPAQMALALVNSRPFVTSNIIGATTMDQLKSNIKSVDVKLSKEVLKEIEKIHQQYPNPCP